jgi:AAA+ ATPase superfamily predicted ATPase
MFRKFENRVLELNALEDLWRADGAQLMIIYGPRRVGKTELIHHPSKSFGIADDVFCERGP